MQDTSGLMRRLGLGVFFLVFGLLKLIHAEFFVAGPYKGFYGINFAVWIIFLIGILQVVMGLSFFSNIFSRGSAWLGSFMILVTIIATFPKIWSIFSLPPAEGAPGFLFFAAVPLFFMALSEALSGVKPKYSSQPIPPPPVSVHPPQNVHPAKVEPFRRPPEPETMEIKPKPEPMGKPMAPPTMSAGDKTESAQQGPLREEH